MDKQALYPINLERAEFIIAQAQKKNGAFKTMLYYLREIEDQIRNRQKTNRQFYQVVHAVEDKHQLKLHQSRETMYHIATEIRHIDYDVGRLKVDRDTLKQELEEHEAHLIEVRHYAEQRRNKKSKRERQYHQLYHVPFVATQFKKKYVRARDKNSDAEEKVSEIRSIVDSCQRAIAEMTRSITDCQIKRQELLINQEQVEQEVKQVEDLVFNLNEGCKFWTNFDQHQLMTASKATTHFIETVQQYNKNNQLHAIDNPHLDTVKIFKMALFEYGEAERYAESRWSSLEVEFECAKCHTPQRGWPKPDKVRVMDLLCDPCYQEYKSSMLWEKRVSGVKDRSQQLLSLPGGSMLSFSSSSTVGSQIETQSNNNRSPGIKKMFKMLKGGVNKRSSSQTTLGSSTQMMMTS
ncbi:hypothetical protein BD560DRAFT_411118 [Blakeslea trispora]|nr:hypothetical protein BD560DRAFT_411118 [Blakeslea trispora]